MPITREKIYEEVWAEPMTTVANRADRCRRYLGMSGEARVIWCAELRKLCSQRRSSCLGRTRCSLRSWESSPRGADRAQAQKAEAGMEALRALEVVRMLAEESRVGAA